MAVTQINMHLQRYMTVPVTVSCFLPGYSPFPLAGASLIWTVSNGSGALITKSTTLGTITILAHTFSFTISAAETLLLPYGDTAQGAQHEAKVLTAGGQVFPVFSGKIRTDGTLITGF